MHQLRRVVIVWALIGSMIHAPSLLSAQEAAKTSPDLGYITPKATVAAVAQPRRVLTAPEMEMFPLEVITAAGQKELGIDPLQIEQITALAEAPEGIGPPQAGVVVRFAVPIDAKRLPAALLRPTVEDKLEGKTYRRGQGMGPSIFLPDDRTLIIATDDLLRRMVANKAKPEPGAASRLLGQMPGSDIAAVLAVDPIRALVSAQLAQAPIPPPFADVRKIPELLSSIEVRTNLTGDMAMSLTLRARDEAAAEQLEKVLDGLMQTGKQMLAAEVAKQAKSEDPVERAAAQYSQRIMDKMLQTLRPQRKKDTLVLAAQGQGTTQIAVIGILIGLLLPAVQAAREAARRAQSTNNLKQIGLSLLNYEAAHKAFPAQAIFDKQGKPLLSWRVQILPYLEQQALYKQFHLDEPWDSEHNRTLIPLMPAVFKNPSSPAERGKTDYLGVAGPGMMFEGNKGRAIADFRDGTSNTVMVVEVNPDRAAIWTKPEDWQYDEKQPLAGLGSAHPGGFSALLADVSVRFIAKTIDPKTFHALLTIAGGEVVASD